MVHPPPMSSVLARHLAALGKKGGKARAAKLTPRQRQMAARKASKARWAKRDAASAESDCESDPERAKPGERRHG